MEINYYKSPLTGIEYFYTDPSDVTAISSGLIYSFPADESKINPLKGITPERINVNPFEFGFLREAAADFNYKKGKELTNKIKRLNSL